MDTIVWILILLTASNFVLKQTFWKLTATTVAAVIAAAFLLLAWPHAIEQSKTQIADWLHRPELMLNTAVVLTVEVALQMAFCLLSVHVANARPVKKRMMIAHRILYWFAGVLIFPVLFFGLTQLIFALPGISFRAVAWGFAGAVMLAIPLGRWFVLRLLPEPELRLELLFLTNACVAVLGIVATVNGRTAVEGVTSVNWLAFSGCVGLFIAGGLIGMLAREVSERIRRR